MPTDNLLRKEKKLLLFCGIRKVLAEMLISANPGSWVD